MIMAPTADQTRARGASPSSAPFRAARPPSSKPSSSAPEPSSAPAASTPATWSAIRAPRPAPTRMSVEPNVATVDVPRRDHDLRRLPRLGGIPARHAQRRCRSATPPSSSARRTSARSRPSSSCCASSRRPTSRASCSSTRSTPRRGASARRWRCCSSASRTPLLLRQIPIWKDGIAVGFIDLALERAFIYREHAPSEVVELPDGELPREKEARFSMLERLADHDDALMEELISEIEPPRDRVFDDLAQRAARAPGRAGADRLGRARQRRHAAAQGAAPRGARPRRDPRAGSASPTTARRSRRS